MAAEVTWMRRYLQATGFGHVKPTPSSPDSSRFMAAQAWLMIVTALAGWYMPEFYDWTGANQSRSAPIVFWIAVGMVLVSLAATAGLLILHGRERRAGVLPASRGQISLRRALITITLLAGAFAIIRATRASDSPWLLNLLTGAAWVIALLGLGRVGYLSPARRLRLATLVGCLYLPSLWVVRKIGLGNVPPLLLAGQPNLLPAAWMSVFLGSGLGNATWAAVGLTAVELFVGVRLTAGGWKSNLAFWLWAITLSLFSSFVLQALVRM